MRVKYNMFLFQLDDEQNLYLGNGWKSPVPSIKKWLLFRVPITSPNTTWLHPWRFNMASHENQVLLEIPGETNRNWVGFSKPSWLQVLPVVQRWGCFPARKLHHHRSEARSCFSKPMLGGRGHVPPSFPESKKPLSPRVSRWRNSYWGLGWEGDTGYGLDGNQKSTSELTSWGELVVEIYHDIYRVSKTSINRWLLRISERSTVRIFDDAPNNKNLRWLNFFSSVLFLFWIGKIKSRRTLKNRSKGIKHEHARVKQIKWEPIAIFTSLHGNGVACYVYLKYSSWTDS